MYGAGYGAGKRRYAGFVGALLRFWRVLFTSQDTESFTLSYTSGTKAVETQAALADRSDALVLDLPPSALVSEDAEKFTIETDNL